MSSNQSVQDNVSSGFNLYYEPWIPVLYTSGEIQTVSLKQLFEDGYSIRKIHSGDATTDVAILGIVVVVLFRAVLKDPSEHKDLEGDPYE